MTKRFAVVLAAGQGTRMQSSLYKVLHPVAGRPMVQHVIDQLKRLEIDEMITVVGFGAEQVIERVGHQSKFVIQEEQLGTGHAVQQAEDLLFEKEGTTIVVCGDTPLITTETYQELFEHHEKEGSKATILTARAPDPTGYGRVIRDANNQVKRIVEHKDAKGNERAIDEINTGTYCFDNKLLFKALKGVSNHNAQGEYYLPDVISILRENGEKISAFLTNSFDETQGINDRVALAQAEKVMRQRINERHMRNGVTIIDPENTYIGSEVSIERDVTIYPGTMINGSTSIGSASIIGPDAEVINCEIGEGSIIKKSVVMDSQIGKYTDVGPYAYIRPSSNVGNHVKVGHFVEVKKSTIGEHSKIPHLSYVGDTEIGRNVNVGCGTITVNYDGKDKKQTKIEDNAFIGCNTNLIAPVIVEEGAYIAAGSTITRDVPEHALAVARAKQKNKEGYALKFKK